MRDKIGRIGGWCSSHFQDLASNLVRDLKSLRALWNYLFLLLYAWVIVWLVLYHADACGTAAIYATAGVVTAIFTNYVWSANAEKKMTGVVPAYGQPDPPPAAPAGGDGDG